MSHNEDHSSHFLLGVGMGAILGVLFAPRPGKETREKLKADASEYFEKGQELFEDAKEEYEENLEPVVKKIMTKMAPVIAELDELSEPHRQDLIEKMYRMAEEGVREGKEGIAKAKKKLHKLV